MTEAGPQLEVEQPHAVARIEAMSDGVFAIAITLLSLRLVIPLRGELDAALADLVPDFFALALSYAVIGSYWVFHHRLFAAVVRFDRRLVWLNLLVLFFIVLMPFTTSVVAQHGNEPLGVLVYAGSLIGAGLASAALTAYIFLHHRMCAASVTPRTIRYAVARSFTVPAYFAASLLLLLVPGAAGNVTTTWVGIPVVLYFVARRYGEL
jgi:uncharacterized membrane protein